MSDEIIIKKLEAANLDQVSRFSMANEDDAALRIFIRSHARKSAEASITQTLVAKHPGERRIIGYVSLMCAEIKLEDAYQIPEKEDVNRYEYQPAVRISRLAVEDNHQGKHVGRLLVETAMGLVITTVMPHVGCRFLILDAKAKSVGFYRRMGFKLLDTETNRKIATPIMFMDLKRMQKDLQAAKTQSEPAAA